MRLPTEKLAPQRALKSKSLAEYQQVEDKIYSFLSELGMIRGGKEVENNEEEGSSSDVSREGRLGVYNNYLENSVLRMPFDPEFDL